MGRFWFIRFKTYSNVWGLWIENKTKNQRLQMRRVGGAVRVDKIFPFVAVFNMIDQFQERNPVLACLDNWTNKNSQSWLGRLKYQISKIKLFSFYFVTFKGYDSLVLSWSSLDKWESLACQITSPFNHMLCCFWK